MILLSLTSSRAEQLETEDDATLPQASKTQTKSESISQGDLDATRIYLNEIGFSPLLTAEEEVYFARRARDGDEQAQKEND